MVYTAVTYTGYKSPWSREIFSLSVANTALHITFHARRASYDVFGMSEGGSAPVYIYVYVALPRHYNDTSWQPLFWELETYLVFSCNHIGN